MTKILEFWLQYQSLNEYSGLISLKIDWFDLSRVFSSTNSKVSILRCSIFFMIQLSQPSACNTGDPAQYLGQEGPLEKEMVTHSLQPLRAGLQAVSAFFSYSMTRDSESIYLQYNACDHHNSYRTFSLA